MATVASHAMSGPGALDDDKYTPDLNAILICPDCNEDPPNLIEEFSSGDMVCESCGLVLGDRIIDTRSEWRTFSNDDQGGDDPSRVGDGPNALLEGDQLQTSIAFGGGGSRAIRNLAHTQSKVNSDKNSKALLSAYRDITHLCEKINAGKSIADSAKFIYKRVDEGKVLKGKAQEAIVAGCIFIACRQAHVPRTFREIHALTKVPKKEIGRIFKQLEAFLSKDDDKKQNMHEQQYRAANSTSADELCARYCSNLRFRNPTRIENVARSLSNKTSSVSDLAGRSPLSVAAACIYMAAHLMGEARSSKDVAIAAGVSDGTVKTAYRHLFNARDSLVDPVWLADPAGGNMDRLPAN